jgi:hypothetical protein
MKCTYKYQGQELTKEEILDVLYYFGEINNEKVSQARKWLKETMGMSDHEIRIISGAIDNKSFARILEDGSILLSDTMEEGAHYHEAFHRVVRMFLTGEQVKNLFNEFRARPDAKRLIARYSAIYKGITEEEVIEEILAEEFREYALSQYEVTNPEQKSLFERILEFFTTLFDKNQTRELYDNIIAAKYNGTPSVYTIKAADMLIGNREFSVDKRREIVDAVNIFFLQSVLDNATIYELMDGNINTTEAYKDAIDAVILSIRDLARKTNDVNLAQDLVAIVNDVYKKVGDKTVFNPESVLIKEHQKFYKAMNISFELVEEDADPDKLDEVAEEGGESSKDQAYDKVSFEFDSKTNIGRAIKLLLAALPSEELSKTYGLYVPISWTESTALLLNELAGLPAEIDIFVNRLSELSHKYPWLKDLIEYLGGYSEGKSFTYPQMKLRNEFVQSFGKYKYDFLIQMFKGDDIYFTDANRFSMIERNIQEWQNNLGLLYEDGAQLLERLKELRGSKASIQEIVQALGMDNILLNPSVLSEEINTSGKDKTVTSAIFEIADIIVKSLEAGNPLTRLYETNIGSFGIRGTLRKISELQSDFQIPVDIQLQNAVGKRIYPINLNTFQTITLNYLNHIAAKVNELGLEYDEALELLKETMPHLINVNTVIEDETGMIVNSLYLNEILHGKPIRLHITDGSRITGGRGKSFHELTETDLLAANFNGTLKGFFPSVKHSDRSTIFAYSMQGGKLFQDVDTELGAQDAYVSLMHNYILNEVNRIKALETGLGADVEFYNQNAKDFTIFSFLSDGVKQRLLAGADVSIADRELEVQFKGLTNELIVKLEEWGLLEDTDNGRPVGISKELWNNAKGSKEDKIKALASAAVLNTFVAHLEETKLFVGDLAFYKSAEDSYKRFKMQSSTGDLTIVDAENNKFIHEVNQRDTVQVYNPRTKEVEVFKYTDKKEVDGTMSEIVLEEVSSFSAEFLKKEVTFGAETSRILGKTTGIELEHMIAQSMYDSYSNSSFSEENRLAFVRKKVNQFVEKYKKINENDGQSYLNLFGWREFMHRAGKWTERLENLFQVELAIAKLPADKSIEDTEIYLSPSGTEFSANAREGWTKFKVFDLSETDVSAKELLSEFMESGTVLKPQYTGPVYLDKKGLVEPSANSLNVIGGRKTSYFVLFPSIIKGTNLQLLNTTMLRNGLDAVHFGSAAKFGRKHSKSIAKEWELSEEIQQNGLRLYNDEGEFNDQLIDETAELFKSYLDYRFMKYQLNIKNKPKEKIKNSTQSMKILIGTIFDKGIPRDISLQEHEWNSLSELEKREMSS